mgnify:CR=1 FL=1
MSAQDKIERILKQIHVLLSEGKSLSGSPDKVIVDRNDVFPILEELNLAINDMMEEYEVTAQARELAERRSEKKGEEMVERVTRQAEDVYAASLIYTDDALNKVHHLITEAMVSSGRILSQLAENLESEQRKVKEDQLELREQLQDFKDSKKYMAMMEECNREREKQKKEPKTQDKKIQNEAKHYGMKVKPEIKVNPAYFERRGLNPDGTKSTVPGAAAGTKASKSAKAEGKGSEDPAAVQEDYMAAGDMVSVSKDPDDAPKPFVTPQVNVDLDAEYFKWQEDKENTDETDENAGKGNKKGGSGHKKDWKSFLGKK